MDNIRAINSCSHTKSSLTDSMSVCASTWIFVIKTIVLIKPEMENMWRTFSAFLGTNSPLLFDSRPTIFFYFPLLFMYLKNSFLQVLRPLTNFKWRRAFAFRTASLHVLAMPLEFWPTTTLWLTFMWSVPGTLVQTDHTGQGSLVAPLPWDNLICWHSSCEMPGALEKLKSWNTSSSSHSD